MPNIYLIEMWDNKESFYKIGTTVHRYCRFYELMKPGYKIKIKYMVFGIEFYESLDAESHLQSCFEKYTPLKKFGGYTECFSYVDLKKYKYELNKIITKYDSITKELEISWR